MPYQMRVDLIVLGSAECAVAALTRVSAGAGADAPGIGEEAVPAPRV
jgi:hypothetical protein